MASQKKKKRSADEFRAPEQPKTSKQGTSPQPKVSQTTQSAKTSSGRREANKTAGKTSLSSRSQWLILASIAGVLVAGLVITSFLSLRGGEGNVDYATWDLPLIGEVDPGPKDGRVKLSDYTGKPLVVKFFNSECTGCSDEYPWLIRVYAQTDAAFGVVFVNVYENADWKSYAEEWQIDLFPIAEDIKGDARDGLLKDLGATRGILPVTAYYDEDGELHRIAYEPTAETVFLAELAELGVSYDGEIPAEVVSSDELGEAAESDDGTESDESGG